MTAVPSDEFMAHRTSLSLLAIYSLAFFLPIAVLADTAEYFYDDPKGISRVCVTVLTPLPSTIMM